MNCGPTEVSCNAAAPFMRAMECIPEDGDDENENPLITSIRSLKRGSYNNNKNNNTNGTNSDISTRLQNLKTRLESFWSKGWLSKGEYEQHLDFLSTFDVSCIGSNGKYALRELETEFDAMEAQKNSKPAPQSWSDMFMSTLGVGSTTTNSKPNKASSSAGLSSFWTNSMAGNDDFHDDDDDSEDSEDSDEESRVSQAQAQLQPLATATHRTVNGAREPTIVSPRDLSNVLSEHAISELFVETCFFARLGFVQPPCCMSCTYREALKGTIPNLECQNWVIWRKNGNRTFDPSNNANMGDNAVVVQCRTARKLSTGKMVEGYQWDARQKMLLRRK